MAKTPTSPEPIEKQLWKAADKLQKKFSFGIRKQIS